MKRKGWEYGENCDSETEEEDSVCSSLPGQSTHAGSHRKLSLASTQSSASPKRSEEDLFTSTAWLQALRIENAFPTSRPCHLRGAGTKAQDSRREELYRPINEEQREMAIRDVSDLRKAEEVLAEALDAIDLKDCAYRHLKPAPLNEVRCSGLMQRRKPPSNVSG